MAIIQCPNCGGSVSDKAQQCPHCHAQLQKQGSGQAQQMGTPRPVVKEESLPASATVAAKPELKAQPTAQKVTTAKEPEVQHYLFESVHSLSRYTFRQMSKKTSVDLTQNTVEVYNENGCSTMKYDEIDRVEISKRYAFTWIVDALISVVFMIGLCLNYGIAGFFMCLHCGDGLTKIKAGSV